MSKDSEIFSKVKTTLDRTLERLNNKFEVGGKINYIVEIQSMEVEGTKHHALFLVKEDGDKTEILLNIPIPSTKLEHKSEAYLQVMTILCDLGLQSLSIMTQQALAKKKAQEASKLEETADKAI